MLVRDTNPIAPIVFDDQNVGRLASLHPEDIVPLLRTNLHWRVARVRHCFRRVDDYKEDVFDMTPQSNQSPRASDQVAGLQVSVSATIACLRP